MIKSKVELEKDFEQKGISKDKEVICYCHVGPRQRHHRDSTISISIIRYSNIVGFVARIDLFVCVIRPS